MGTVTMLGMGSGRVLAVAPMVNPSPVGNHWGGLESEGTRYTARFLQSLGENVQLFLHDGNSSWFSALKTIFPDANERVCILHTSKNLGKYVAQNISQEQAQKIQIYWKRCAISAAESEQPEENFVSAMQVMLKHYAGNHSACSHKGIHYTENMALDDTGIRKLEGYLAPHMNDPIKHCHGKSLSRCERFHKQIGHYVPKSVYEPHLYRSRVYFAVCAMEMGIQQATLTLMHHLGLQVHPMFLNYLAEAHRSVLYHQHRYDEEGEKHKHLRRNHQEYERMERNDHVPSEMELQPPRQNVMKIEAIIN